MYGFAKLIYVQRRADADLRKYIEGVQLTASRVSLDEAEIFVECLLPIDVSCITKEKPTFSCGFYLGGYLS